MCTMKKLMDINVNTETTVNATVVDGALLLVGANLQGAMQKAMLQLMKKSKKKLLIVLQLKIASGMENAIKTQENVNVSIATLDQCVKPTMEIAKTIAQAMEFAMEKRESHL